MHFDKPMVFQQYFSNGGIATIALNTSDSVFRLTLPDTFQSGEIFRSITCVFPAMPAVNSKTLAAAEERAGKTAAEVRAWIATLDKLAAPVFQKRDVCLGGLAL